MDKYIFSKLVVAVAVSSLALSGCEPKDEFEAQTIVVPDEKPMTIVRVEPDDGVTRVNSLPKAIEENGDAIYELERGGVYYLEGKNVIKRNVVVRAGNGTGELPIIQPISDAQGALNADMLRFEGNAVFQNVYISGKDAASNNIMQRLFRIDSKNIKLTFENCFVEYCRNFCIRIDNKNSKIQISNSTFRNISLTSDPANGRLIDTRGNAQDSISITNSTIYNLTGHLIRFNNALTNYLELRNNTIYNDGFHMKFDYVMTAYVENNIFADVGWKAGYTTNPSPFWEFKSYTGDNADKQHIVIRNNNVFTDSRIEALYDKYPDNYKRIGLNSDGTAMIEDGRLTFENNFSEMLRFDNAPDLPMEYITKFFEVVGAGMSPYADLPFNVDEDGVEGIHVGQTYTFNYQASSKSATSSTTGGPIGSGQWRVK